MSKYLETGKAVFKTMLAYRFDVFTGIIGSLLKVLLAFAMWRTIFASKSEIAGFSLPMMVTYYIITGFLAKLNQSTNVVWEFSGEIRNGQFTKYLVRPLDTMLYFMTLSLSRTVYMFGLNFGGLVLLGMLFHRYFLLPANGTGCVAGCILFLLGLFFMIQLDYFIAILSFKFLEVGVLMMVTETILEFMNGGLVPLSLLPEPVLAVFRLLPFYYTLYYPTLLYLGRDSGELGLGIMVIVTWSAIMFGINRIIYQKFIRLYEGVGI